MMWWAIGVVAGAAALLIWIGQLRDANRTLSGILAEEIERRNDEDAADAHAMEPWGEPS